MSKANRRTIYFTIEEQKFFYSSGKKTNTITTQLFIEHIHPITDSAMRKKHRISLFQKYDEKSMYHYSTNTLFSPEKQSPDSTSGTVQKE